MTLPACAAAVQDGSNTRWIVPQPVAERAVQWWLTLQELPPGDAAQSQRRAFHAWFTADPLHKEAWQRIEAINGRLASLGAENSDRYGIAQATLLSGGACRPARRQAVQVLAMAFFGATGAWMAARHAPWREWMADERTALGERRTVVLSDGTQIVLNSASALQVGFSGAERRLSLLAGEVLVTTAPDHPGSARPFLVETAHGEALALGTRYSVRRERDDATCVSVFEGAVRLTPRRSPQTTQLLRSGEQAILRAGAIAMPMAVREDDATAWVHGMVVARGMRLVDLLAQLQPYSAHTLVCDPAVAGLRVSGTYPVADVPKVLDTLSAVLSLEVHTVTRLWGLQVVHVGLAPPGSSGV